MRTPNDVVNVVYLTLRADGDLDERQRAAVEEIVARAGGSALWRINATMRRAYALLELPDARIRDDVRGVWRGTAYDGPIIALAVFPAALQALQPVLESLGGRGRPSGVVGADRCDGAAVIEWDPEMTDSRVVTALVDLELRRFGSSRTAELLTPLPPALAAKVAADGLHAPQISPERILEARIDSA